MIKDFKQFVNENYEVSEDGALGANAKPDTQGQVSATIDAGNTFDVGKSTINRDSASYKSAIDKINAALEFNKGMGVTKKLTILVTGGASAIPFKNSTAEESVEKNKKLATDRANAFVTAAKSDLKGAADKVEFKVLDPVLGTHTSGDAAKAEQFVKIQSSSAFGGSSAIDSTSTAAVPRDALAKQQNLKPISLSQNVFVSFTIEASKLKKDPFNKDFKKLLRDNGVKTFNFRDLPYGKMTASAEDIASPGEEISLEPGQDQFA